MGAWGYGFLDSDEGLDAVEMFKRAIYDTTRRKCSLDSLFKHAKTAGGYRYVLAVAQALITRGYDCVLLQKNKTLGKAITEALRNAEIEGWKFPSKRTDAIVKFRNMLCENTGFYNIKELESYLMHHPIFKRIMVNGVELDIAGGTAESLDKYLRNEAVCRVDICARDDKYSLKEIKKRLGATEWQLVYRPNDDGTALVFCGIRAVKD